MQLSIQPGMTVGELSGQATQLFNATIAVRSDGSNGSSGGRGGDGGPGGDGGLGSHGGAGGHGGDGGDAGTNTLICSVGACRQVW